jgi:hypothetical protein
MHWCMEIAFRRYIEGSMYAVSRRSAPARNSVFTRSAAASLVSRGSHLQTRPSLEYWGSLLRHTRVKGREPRSSSGSRHVACRSVRPRRPSGPDRFAQAKSEAIRPSRASSRRSLSQPVEKPPSGPQWLHEIKLDGFRTAREPISMISYRRSGLIQMILAAAGTILLQIQFLNAVRS